MYSQAATHMDKAQQSEQKKVSKNAIYFIIFTILWEIVVLLIIGFLFGYDPTLDVTGSSNFFLNVQVLMALFIFMVAGFTLTSAYVTQSSATNMTFSILVALFTLQNWFIYRCFWNKVGLSLEPIQQSFNGKVYNEISYLPTNNFRRDSSQYSTAAFYDAIGACIAMFCALSPLLGRIGFLEVFFLSWVGPFFYEINSSIFNKFFIVDTGFGMRGFLFGGMLGLWISFIMGKVPQTKQGNRFKSHYHINALALIGGVLICLTYPNLVSTALLVYSDGVPSIAGVIQINSWFSLGGSIVGVYTANSIVYKKLNVHDVIFVSLSGAIAFSCSTSINYNPGAAIAIGSFVGFFCGLIHTPVKRWMNDGGVLESNSVIVQFIIPGIIACIMSSILQAIDQTSFLINWNNAQTYFHNRDPNRTASGQAGWQLIGFCFSLGSSLLCSVFLGLIFRAIHNRNIYSYFNDLRFIDYGKGNEVLGGRYRDQ